MGVAVSTTLSNVKLLVLFVVGMGAPNCCRRLVAGGDGSAALCMEGLLGTDCEWTTKKRRKEGS